MSTPSEVPEFGGAQAITNGFTVECYRGWTDSTWDKLFEERLQCAGQVRAPPGRPSIELNDDGLVLCGVG